MTSDIISGTVVLDVTNPFSVGFDGTITVGTVVKNVTIPTDASSSIPIAFTGDELRSFLGTPNVTFSGSGTISGGPAAVTPDATLEIDPSIDLLLEIGG